MMVNDGYISGWWLSPTPPEQYEFVSWDDDDIPNLWKKNIHVPNHQPGLHRALVLNWCW